MRAAPVSPGGGGGPVGSGDARREPVQRAGRRAPAGDGVRNVRDGLALAAQLHEVREVAPERLATQEEGRDVGVMAEFEEPGGQPVAAPLIVVRIQARAKPSPARMYGCVERIPQKWPAPSLRARFPSARSPAFTASAK